MSVRRPRRLRASPRVRARRRPPARSARASCRSRRASPRPFARRRASFEPRAQKRRLSGAGRRRDECQPPAGDGRRQALEEPGPRDHPPAPAADRLDLRLGNRPRAGGTRLDGTSFRRSRLGPLVSWPRGHSQQGEAETTVCTRVFGRVQTALWGVVLPPAQGPAIRHPERVICRRWRCGTARQTYGRSQSRPVAVMSKPEVDVLPSARVQSVMLPQSSAAPGGAPRAVPRCASSSVPTRSSSARASRACSRAPPNRGRGLGRERGRDARGRRAGDARRAAGRGADGPDVHRRGHPARAPLRVKYPAIGVVALSPRTCARHAVGLFASGRGARLSAGRSPREWRRADLGDPRCRGGRHRGRPAGRRHARAAQGDPDEGCSAGSPRASSRCSR